MFLGRLQKKQIENRKEMDKQKLKMSTTGDFKILTLGIGYYLYSSGNMEISEKNNHRLSVSYRFGPMARAPTAMIREGALDQHNQELLAATFESPPGDSFSFCTQYSTEYPTVPGVVFSSFLAVWACLTTVLHSTFHFAMKEPIVYIFSFI